MSAKQLCEASPLSSNSQRIIDHVLKFRKRYWGASEGGFGGAKVLQFRIQIVTRCSAYAVILMYMDFQGTIFIHDWPQTTHNPDIFSDFDISFIIFYNVMRMTFNPQILYFISLQVFIHIHGHQIFWSYNGGGGGGGGEWIECSFLFYSYIKDAEFICMEKER